jgi:hypothetical protein
MIFSDPIEDRALIKSRLLTLIDNLSGESLLALLEKAERLPLKGNRKELRKICALRVMLTVQGQAQPGTAHDISYSGIFVGNEMPIPSGSEITVTFQTEGGQAPGEIKGEVVRNSSLGDGIQFKSLSAQQKEFVKALVDSL